MVKSNETKGVLIGNPSKRVPDSHNPEGLYRKKHDDLNFKSLPAGGVALKRNTFGNEFLQPFSRIWFR